MSMKDHQRPMLVTGATGAQGGAVVQTLLAQGRAVSALVRDPATPKAQALAKAGAALAVGDLNDPASLATALNGAGSVFSVQLFNPSDAAGEVRQAEALATAARRARVGVFIQSSVSGAGGHEAMPGWVEGRWDRDYWLNKARVEELALAAGFDAAVVLKPAFMMENLIAPKSAWMFPNLADGLIVSAMAADTALALVATEDIGAAASAVVAAPERFDGQRIELAGDRLTLTGMAETLSAAWARPIRVETQAADAVVARGQSPGWVQTQLWLNEIGYPARPEMMSPLGVRPTPLAEWATAKYKGGEA